MHLVGNRMEARRAKAAAPPKLSPSEVKNVGRVSMALAALPSRDEVGEAYVSIGERIDAIADKAEKEGSLAVAVMSLRELRATVREQATLAGHIGSGATVAVQVNNTVDLSGAVAELAAILKPVADKSIPKRLLRHIEDGPPDPVALKRLESVIDAD